MLRKSIYVKKIIRRLQRRLFTTSCNVSSNNTVKLTNDINKIRNIGILAHIDAGKTTTTERMLFYSGKIRIMGEVHDGNTVTDYMEQERDRGITITSAAVTFPWKGYQFNLIDTPGHIDFTMEVEQALHVTDGAIVILDASAGVEAQTLTVWRQADNYSIPRIVYANKMDRSDADINLCVSTIIEKLGSSPLLLQIPLKNNGKLVGIIDIIRKERLTWQGDRGQKYTKTQLTESDGNEWERVMIARSSLTDKLTDLDDALAETVINLDSIDKIDEKNLADAVRRVTLSQRAVPLVCGSSYKNIGVQPLMDTIVKYLPSPMECPHQKFYASCFKNNLSCKAFKVVHDKMRGPMTFFRIYSGTLNKNQKILNVKQNQSEQTGRVMVPYADEYEEVAELGAGNVAAVMGLKNAYAGDLVTNTNSALVSAREVLSSENKFSQEEIDEKFGVGIKVPDPVFFCSIEPGSLKYQVPLEAALKELQREDPSLHVKYDSETGQTVLGGMGELHIEVIKQRIAGDYKVEVDLGPLYIAYKEQLLSEAKETHILSHQISSTIQYVKITLSVIPEVTKDRSGKVQLLTLDKSPDNVANVTAVSPRRILLIKQGIKSALAHGPTIGAMIDGATFKLHWFETRRSTTEPMLIAAVSQCVKKLLEQAGTVLLEPIMSLEIVTNEESLSAVMADLSSRRSTVEHVGLRGNSKLVLALVPLSELLGYSKDLRIITSGMGSFTMEFSSYQRVSPDKQNEIIQELGGV